MLQYKRLSLKISALISLLLMVLNCVPSMAAIPHLDVRRRFGFYNQRHTNMTVWKRLLCVVDGTPHTGDVLHIIFTGGVPGSPYDYTYTVQPSDTTATLICAGLVAGFNTDTTLRDKGITAQQVTGDQYFDIHYKELLGTSVSFNITGSGHTTVVHSYAGPFSRRAHSYDYMGGIYGRNENQGYLFDGEPGVSQGYQTVNDLTSEYVLDQRFFGASMDFVSPNGSYFTAWNSDLESSDVTAFALRPRTGIDVRFYDLTNKRIWFGLFHTGHDAAHGGGYDGDDFGYIMGTDTPSASNSDIGCIAFRYSTNAGDTTLKAVVSTGGADLVYDTGVTVEQDKNYELMIDCKSLPGYARFYVNNQLVYQTATGMPADALGMFYTASQIVEDDQSANPPYYGILLWNNMWIDSN